MKKLLCLLISLSGLYYGSSAQNCAPNGITTNPAAPVNSQRPSKRNTFDWTRPSYPLRTSITTINATAINSPFFTTDNPNIGQFYDPNDGIKDVYPSQGWELIKRDFGYNDLNQPNNPAATNPYLILYNKYRGLLRVLVARVENNSYNGANIQIYFDKLSPMQTSLLDNNAELKAIDGTFTTDPALNSIPEFLNLPLKWFYADFPVLYDPCTCLFSSKLNVRITLTNTSKVTGITTTTGNLVSDGKPTSAQNANGSFSIGDVASTTKKAVQAYKGSYAFETNIKPALKKSNGTADTDKQAKLGLFARAMEKSDFLRTGLGAIPYLGDALSIVDFFVGGGKKSNAPQKVEITPMTINMTGKYTGEIVTPYNYNAISFRTPGSNVSSAPDSEYPYYNEVMGVFTLLRTPRLQVRHYTTFSNGSARQLIFLKLATDLQYVVNPASGLEVQEIQAAIVGGNLNDLNGNYDPLNSNEDRSFGIPYYSETRISFEGKNATYGDQYRTNYKNIGCLARNTFNLSRPTSGFISTPNWRLKVVVNLRRKDATTNTQNVLFVATYPITTDIVQYSSAQDPGFTAFVGTLSSCGGIPPAVSASAINTFCNSSAYKTSQRKFVRYHENLQKMEEQEQRQQESSLNLLPDLLSDEVAIYPNPATDQATLQYHVSASSTVRVTIRGVILNRIETLVEKADHPAGDFQLTINTSSYAKGVYFCSIQIDNRTITKKLIIQ